MVWFHWQYYGNEPYHARRRAAALLDNAPARCRAAGVSLTIVPWTTISGPRGHRIALMEITQLALIILVPLLVWRVYKRLQRMMTRTESHVWQHWTLLLACMLFIVVGAINVRDNALALATLAAGVLGGIWAGVLGLKLSRFQRTREGFFYTPHRQLGVLVALLFIARVMYRGLELYVNSRAPVPQPLSNAAFMENPLTTLSFGLATAYYAWYGYGLLRWRRAQQPLMPEKNPLDPDLP